ncbi:MAG: hypothetical protein KatS3mg002_0890 [Candidatus Woesearchaeota archaeon]|nr:MAG: hypothetical protein KatS3mg002_0890 [Candidatus Woesearchaeota archaeon]
MMLEDIKKIYIPDTNIAIDDTYFMKDLLKDKENAVILPDVIIEEIDKLKKSSDVGIEARLFINYLYNLMKKGYNNSGMHIYLDDKEKNVGGKFIISNDYDLNALKYTTNIGLNDLKIISLAKKTKK